MGVVRMAAAIAAVACTSALAENVIPGDARRGAQLFESESCNQCHSINGRGGRIAPDLGRRIDRSFTPATLASLMWNHAPTMWAAMRTRGIVKATLSPESAADLFAYFMSTRFFEKPGDAGRGKQLFTAKHCAGCHGITSSPNPAAPPVAKWESLADPTVLVQGMWNHGAGMRRAFEQKKLAYVQLTSQELTDILVYLQNLPQTKDLVSNLSFPPAAGGKALFESKGCVKCHVGANALEKKLHNRTITDIAVAMWNHQPKMQANPPTFNQEEMRQLLAYIWARQYFTGQGSAARGRTVFEEKQCATCHSASGGAPSLASMKGSFSDISMVSVLWEHGPRMLERMKERNIAWPRFTQQQMADLIAYLNTQ